MSTNKLWFGPADLVVMLYVVTIINIFSIAIYGEMACMRAFRSIKLGTSELEINYAMIGKENSIRSLGCPGLLKK